MVFSNRLAIIPALFIKRRREFLAGTVFLVLLLEQSSNFLQCLRIFFQLFCKARIGIRQSGKNNMVHGCDCVQVDKCINICFSKIIIYRLCYSCIFIPGGGRCLITASDALEIISISTKCLTPMTLERSSWFRASATVSLMSKRLSYSEASSLRLHHTVDVIHKHSKKLGGV
jgi:hypothetical protein